MGLSTWLAMGGYAVFVWPAYGVAAAALGLLAIGSVRRYRMAQRRLARIPGARRGEDS
ncbi:MAG TPA: heme exporter protein CcmD [Aliidongia sp.]|uniref:heme exporter protein CcmD n=1 Tax=Aliidongia sp. TaxID=1914230 RepID=UPI002DDD1038|nr:heme exporter protein CcmD [Aliidongia sp.]HEV2678267.1 heme exporter protein CcmD [Aliidongia sp.]